MKLGFGLSINNWLMGSASDPIDEAITSAKTSLGLRDEFIADQVLLIDSGPAIDGVITDENNGLGDARSIVGGRAATFNSTNQYFTSSGQLTGTSKTQLTAWAWVRSNGSGNGIMGEYGNSSNKAWLIWNDGGKLSVIVSKSGTTSTLFKSYRTNKDIDDDNWHLVGFTFDAGTLTLYIDGKAESLGVQTDTGTCDAIFDPSTDFQISGFNDGNTFDGEISLAGYYHGVWTATNWRDFYLNDTTPSITKMFLLGEKEDDVTAGLRVAGCWDLVGTDHLTPQNIPTLYEDANIPSHLWDYDTVGYRLDGMDYIPKRIDAALAADGNALTQTGKAPRNAQLAGAGCIDLNGTNQYGAMGATIRGLIKEAASFSFRIQFNPDTVSGNQAIFSSINGTGGSLDAVVLKMVGDELRFVVSAPMTSYKKSGATLLASTWYDAVVSFNTSDNTVKLWLDGTELTGTTGLPPSGMGGGTNCDIGQEPISSLFFNGQIRRFELVTAAVASVSAFNSATKSKIYPIAEKSGTTSYGTVAEADPDIAWTNSPSWATQNDYFWNQIYGATLDGSVYVPALLGGGTDAEGDAIGLPAGEYLNNTAETVNLAPVSNTQWIKYTATTADFGGSTSEVALDHTTISEARTFKIEVTVNFDNTTGDEAVYSSTSGTSDRIVINREGTYLRYRVYDGTTDADRHKELTSIAPATEYKIVAEWDGSSVATMTVNGATIGTGTAAQVDGGTGSYVGMPSSGSTFGSIAPLEGTVRDLKLTDNGTLKVDIPLALNSLDYTANVDHGADTAVTYLSHAGTKTYGTVTTPQSVDAGTSNQEKTMITFTIGT